MYYRTILNIIKTGHWITDHVSHELREYDITEPQYNVLRILKSYDGRAVSVQAIQKGMVQKSSNVTRIIDKLLDKKLVDRRECPSNRRRMDISITDEGVDYLKILDRKVEKIHQSMKGSLTKN